MKFRNAMLVALLAGALGFGGAAYAQHDHGDGSHSHDHAEKGPAKVTLEGRLIDLSCYTMGMGGDRHAKCAMACATKGLPVGLKVNDGEKIYTVVLPAPKLSEYMEKTVRLTGKVLNGSLIVPEAMAVMDGDSWTSIEVPKAM